MLLDIIWYHKTMIKAVHINLTVKKLSKGI